MDKTKLSPFNDNGSVIPEITDVAYSTFDPELSKMMKDSKGTIPERKAILERAAQKLSKSKLAKFNSYVAGKYIEILTRKDMREQWLQFDKMFDAQKIELAQNLIDEMAEIFDKTRKIIPNIPVIQYDEDIMAFWTSNKDPNVSKLRINVNDKDNRIVERFLVNLFHEFIHILDHFVPNITPLGAQIGYISLKNMVQINEDKDAYYANPTEINAYMTRFKMIDIIHFLKENYSSRNKEKSEIPKTPFHFFTNVKLKD
jgi:hypothetical protein